MNDPVACAAASRQLMELARRVALSECTVLIAGESGSGKEVLARYIHNQSRRAAGPFVAVNCAAIPENMLEATLFGWERGAFTGAQAAHAGKFEQAQAGTLLLDEISEMPLALQSKLLRVLQEREVERLGARSPVGLDVRVLATTNRRLREEVTNGRFREDLYYRLNVFPLAPLPLRARRDDILPLAMRMLAAHSRPGARIPALHPEAAHLLLTYDWPGNVRELENVMQRALVLCDSDIVRAHHIAFEPPAETSAAAAAAAAPAFALAPPSASVPVAVAAPVAEVPVPSVAERPVWGVPLPRTVPADAARVLAQSLAIAERHLILEALRASHGSRERVARTLGISPRTLRYKLARLRAAGIDLGALSGSAA
ncbi:MAG: sigma-54 interaction domain-containing protein [Steroidobacterales bacterium]